MHISPSLVINEDLVKQLPLPLAQLYRRAVNAKTAFDRHFAAFYLWEMTIKLIGMVAVAEHAAWPIRDARIAEALQKLARPTFGYWRYLVRILVPFLAQKDRGFAELKDVLSSRLRDKFPLAMRLSWEFEGRVKPPSGATGLDLLFDQVVIYRNQEIGHGAIARRADEFYERFGKALLAGAEEVLQHLDVLAGRRLIYVSEVRHVGGYWDIARYQLTGETSRRISNLTLAQDDNLRTGARVARVGPPDAGQVHLASDEGPLRPVYPLLIFDLDTNEALFFNSRRGQHGIDYLSYTSGRIVSQAIAEPERTPWMFGLLSAATDKPGEDEVPAESASEAKPDDILFGEKPSEQLARDSTAQPAGLGSIGGYDLSSVRGRGTLSVVYRAWQRSLQRQVALKVLNPTDDPILLSHFLREIRTLAQVDHPNLVKLIDAGIKGNQFFVAMELIEGTSLAKIVAELRETCAAGAEVEKAQWSSALRVACERSRAEEGYYSRESPAPPEFSPVRSWPNEVPTEPRLPHGEFFLVATDLIRQVAEAVHALHEAGYVHRNMKPANILVTQDGSRAVLAEIGLPQLADDERGPPTWTRELIDTMRYASPELVVRPSDVDRRSDVYSLGATLWELLTLRPLIAATEEMSTPELVRAVLSQTPKPVRDFNPRVPIDLEAVVMKCLQKEPSRRYQTTRELANDLQTWLLGGPVKARFPGIERAPMWAQRPKRIRRSPAFAFAVAGIALVAIFLALLFWFRPRAYAASTEASAAGTEAFAWTCAGLLGVLCAAQASVLVWLLRRRPVAASERSQIPSPTPAPAIASPPRRRLQFQPGEAFSSQTVVLHYPAPIALAYRRFTWASEPRDRLFRLFLAFQATLRYLVTLGLSDLFQCKLREKGMPTPLPKHQAFDLLRAATRMTLGRWVHSLRELADSLSKQPQRFIRELPEVCKSGGLLQQHFYGWLTERRNDEFHPDGDMPATEDECRKLLHEARPRLERLLQEIQFVRNYPLGFLTPGYEAEAGNSMGHYRAHSGMGARAAFGEGMFVLETLANLPVERPFVSAPDGDRLLYLWPLLLQRESDRTQKPSLYVFETIAEGSAFLGRAEFASIDHEDTWKESLHANADSHDWLWRALRDLPAVATIDPDIGLVERLANPLAGSLTGETLGPYQLSRPIAKGGFGTVYDAADKRNNDRVAVKVLEIPDGLRRHDQDQLYQRFRQEFESLRHASVGCRHVVRCFQSGVTPKGNRYYPWYSMEFAAGGDLTARLVARRATLGTRIAWDEPVLRSEALAEFRAVATAVAHLHELGFVHRDIKPGNILLVEEPAGSVVKLSDFGLIKELEESHGMTTTGALVGTRGYMAPEQERGGPVAVPADIYALGMLLAELATGFPPELDLLVPAGSRIEGDKRLDRLPDLLRKLIVRCTDIHATRRPEKALYLLSDLDVFAARLIEPGAPT